MSQKNVSPSHRADPRHAALNTLRALAAGTEHADTLIDRELAREELAGPDRGLYRHLVFGVLRRQGTLDHYLALLVTQPLQKLEEPLRHLLRLGLFQLLYLDRVPPHAAVHATVELAKRVLPRASGLVNGVLRSFLRSREQLCLPDRACDPGGWLAATHSVPRWLIEQWRGQMPEEEVERLAAATSAEPPLTLRANTLRIGRDDLMARFGDAGISCEPCRYAPEGIRLEGHFFIPSLPGFAEGLFAVQDEASQLVAHLLAPQPGQRVLDACAAPGGKTLHLAQLMGDSGSILATDLTDRKLARVLESAQRLGISCVRTLAADVSRPEYLHGELFDRILLDAPCSGLGVIRRNPEAKWRLTPADIERCARRQRLLLSRVANLLAPGGSLVYATCSTAPEEDEQVVADFLSHHRQFVIEKGLFFSGAASSLLTTDGALRLWPHRHGTDGFFAVLLTRHP
ncbi:16S rRNA (cytosine(967)-C(5))-methyltransferase RsmB [Trichlorobacter ammonificans]|uniref:16S rRNA (cytosine(967)-C(5))-methyltransferase n=1 Tax=Trichlorobacter ammonificans TaxID=2916410 RepID=A0ABN8HIC6_9BACT|nr:16S rRNA (cytosine(967)-C(5))-methyltransferase RsmB [Trichlorobacter ammonificans]CAH2032508.1 Ribosomal RNA small subunit methyltransferase B [Trichlorobacter ammonificans]